MQDQTFELIPYPADPIPNIRVGGYIKRIENQLSVFYGMQGDIDNLLLPVATTSTRQDDLWRATCFEFFLAAPDSPEYWEFNMSPSSAWNVYHMDAYRRIGFCEEHRIQQLPFEFQKTDVKDSRDIHSYFLDISVNLTPILPAEQKIQVGITAILQTNDHNETYWALAHPGQQADFHLRDSFIISC